ncbi:MAG: flagellar hook-length control protein FliK [Oceanospirillaceae bacterium]|nr:flagellar hook-length control protein FliK [Oceanospirillaceae bacterium]
MQTSNFQLSFAVKPSSANSPSGLAPGGIGQGANADGFANWMREASNRPAQFDRAESKSLPQEGSSLPSESRSDSPSRSESAREVESKGDKGDEIDAKDDHSDVNSSLKSHSDKDDVGASPKSDKQDVKSEDAVNASSSDSTENTAADATSETDSQGGALTNDLVSEDGVEALGSALAASQMVAEEAAETEDGINVVTPEGAETLEQTDSELAGRASREASDAVLVDLPGKPEEAQLAELAAKTLGQATSAEPKELSNIQQSNSEALFAEVLAPDGELPDPTVTGLGAEGEAGVTDAEMKATQLNSSDELVQTQVVDELDQKPLVDSVGSAEPVALASVTADATRSAESRPINQPTAGASADRIVTDMQPQTSNTGGQQTGADSQNGRQPLMQQVAQASAGDDSSKGAAAETQSSLAKTSASVAPAADAPGRLVPAAAQTSVSTAVPPQALNRMQQANWGQKLGERSLMMVQHGPRVAFVQLDPPELGALQVRVHLQHGDQVSLNITAPNAAVKEVLEQHLPRLREMFAEQGLNLSQSDVRDQSAGQRDRNESGESGGRGRYTDQAEEAAPAMMEMDVPVGMVDYYA